MEDKIRARIAELTKNRDDFILQANQQIAATNAAIAELTAIVEPAVNTNAPEETK